MLDEKDALTAENEKTVVAELVVAAVPTFDNDALLDVNEDDDCKLEGTVGLDEVERDSVRRKLRELQEKCRAKRRKVLTSVAEAFTLANELLDSVEACMSVAERATRTNLGEELGVES